MTGSRSFICYHEALVMAKANFFKKLIGDSILSIIGMILMTAAAQFLVYPNWEHSYGTEHYGNIIYMLSLMNVVCITFGSAVSYTRIITSAKHETKNAPYLRLMTVLSIITLAYAVIVSLINNTIMSYLDISGFVILCVLTVWRSYSDVEYRIHLNYKGYFTYYVVIGIGYVIGMLVMPYAKTWTVALILGEIAGLSYVYFKGHILKKDSFDSAESSEMLKLFYVLVGSYFINTLIFNADRILLKNAIGSTAVSIFYVSSLLGKTLSLVTTPLNGVISGYIAKFKGKPSLRSVCLLILGATIVAFAAAGVCTLGAYIILPVLYPTTFDSARGSIFICSISQTFFFSTNILSVIMLRFADKKYQLYSNIIYAIAFAAICIPLTVIGGMSGFYIGLVLTSLSRFIYNSVVIIFACKNKEVHYEQ